jgi:hypothetical protein
MKNLSKRDFWQELVPEFKIASRSSSEEVSAFRILNEKLAPVRSRFNDDGYIHIPPVKWPDFFTLLPAVINRISDLGLPPAFIFIYDEPWKMIGVFHSLVDQLLGSEAVILPDFWVWKVDPQKGHTGWAPHRDKGPRSLFSDGSAKTITVWIPVTDAKPDNGCMYVLPASRDSNYRAPALDLAAIDVTSIVALPAAAGSILCWNQAVTHWGGKTNPREKNPRMSIAYEFQRADLPPFNQPIITKHSLPNFENRIKLVCKQILQYRHMYPLTRELEKFALSHK